MNERDSAPARSRLKRARWRLRGAWLWPTFVVATLLEMALLHVQPVQGEATGWVAGLLVAGFLNLTGVGLVGTLGGRALCRRRPDMPRVVADDYAGTVVLGLVAAGLLVAGVLHRPALADRRAAFAEQSQAVREWIAINGDAFARAHVSVADSVVIDEDLFRTCVPARDVKRPLCLIVDTETSPPVVKRDRSREPNALFNPRGSFR